MVDEGVTIIVVWGRKFIVEWAANDLIYVKGILCGKKKFVTGYIV